MGVASAVPGQSLHPARVLQRHPRHPHLQGNGSSVAFQCALRQKARGCASLLCRPRMPSGDVCVSAPGFSLGSSTGLPRPCHSPLLVCPTARYRMTLFLEGGHSGQAFPLPKDRSQREARLSVLSSHLSVSPGDQDLGPEEELSGMSQCPLQFLSPRLPHMTPGLKT